MMETAGQTNRSSSPQGLPLISSFDHADKPALPFARILYRKHFIFKYRPIQKKLNTMHFFLFASVKRFHRIYVMFMLSVGNHTRPLFAPFSLKVAWSGKTLMGLGNIAAPGKNRKSERTHLAKWQCLEDSPCI